LPRQSPYRIELSDEERVELESLARSYTLPYWQVTRARMVLMAADGMLEMDVRRLLLGSVARRLADRTTGIVGVHAAPTRVPRRSRGRLRYQALPHEGDDRVVASLVKLLA
jgi:hypothetical protein